MNPEYKSFYKTVGGDEGDKCLYSTRLDTYGCGCMHNCKYCYAKSLLSFRGLWNDKEPSVADIHKIEKVISTIPKRIIVRLGGMSDCFQPLEQFEKITLQTIKLLNQYRIGYLIVTKSHLVADNEYMSVFDKDLAHIQITVTCLDDEIAKSYENASLSSMRLKAIYDLQQAGFDVALRISPLIEEYIDFPLLNSLNIDKCLVEFLRVNSFIKKQFPKIDYSKYTLRHGNYYHLPLDEKQRLIKMISLDNVSVCEDVLGHYEYWKNHYNPNKFDCCNLRTNTLTIRNINLPQNIEELRKFALVGREKIVSIRAEIRAIDKLGLANDVRRQKLEEAQMISEAVLDTEMRIGALTVQIPKATNTKGNQYTDKWKNDNAVENPKSKSETIKNLGFTAKQIERFETLAKNPHIVEQAKAEARGNDDIVSRSLVLEKIKSHTIKVKNENPIIVKTKDVYIELSEMQNKIIDVILIDYRNDKVNLDITKEKLYKAFNNALFDE